MQKTCKTCKTCKTARPAQLHNYIFKTSVMKSNIETSRMRIYVSSTDKVENKPVYESIIYKAKQAGIAGATAFRGVMGFGASSVIHTSKLWELTEKLPVVIEIVDEKSKIISFFESLKPGLDKMSKGCLVTVEHVEVFLYKAGNKPT
jgi:PII-like signaling protein